MFLKTIEYINHKVQQFILGGHKKDLDTLHKGIILQINGLGYRLTISIR